MKEMRGGATLSKDDSRGDGSCLIFLLVLVLSFSLLHGYNFLLDCTKSRVDLGGWMM